jgi:DNA-binding response OmpR family regulator
MKILVAGAQKKTADLIRRGIEQAEVHTVQDGEKCLVLALGQTFKLIVLDGKLPKKDGLSVLKELRSRNIWTPVLMLTSQYSVEEVVAVLDSGSDGYLTKPFAGAELLARVRALLRRSEFRGGELRFADLHLDPVTHKVWREHKIIDLTAKEYGLLEFFMRNPRTIVTRSMIVERAWLGGHNFTNVIEVYINYLRRKIDGQTDRKLIHTVRGLGYILKEA